MEKDISDQPTTSCQEPHHLPFSIVRSEPIAIPPRVDGFRHFKAEKESPVISSFPSAPSPWERGPKFIPPGAPPRIELGLGLLERFNDNHESNAASPTPAATSEDSPSPKCAGSGRQGRVVSSGGAYGNRGGDDRTSSRTIPCPYCKFCGARGQDGHRQRGMLALWFEWKDGGGECPYCDGCQGKMHELVELMGGVGE